LNNKGQFSIIAALLVAVILISTVIVTYSTIRNSPIPNQPQVLSAIDETNFAIKQILGFTVGYYGSVLKITGNSSYARMLATDYLQSGLVNVANMHPDWGTSFDVRNIDMHTYWFTNTSYSMGNLAINYSLGGLGIYGITYETACKLAIQVEKTTSSNQTQLIVTKDGDEPLINLGKQNFKFYRYLSSNSTWKLINPSNEPIAFANGTYLIDIPSGVDPYSYVVQVEDPRGIIVVASSFNHYTCMMKWNPEKMEDKYAVTGTAAQILGAPDKVYVTINRTTCEVTSYQSGTGVIKQVYFKIYYYGSGTLNWQYKLDSGSWTLIESLSEGGSELASLTRTYNATSLRASWSWSNLNATSIRFENSKKANAYVDAIYVTIVVEKTEFYSNLQNATIVVELLQNGTMRWLGQNLQLTTQAKPIPPIPVRAVRVSQTINGINQEVPFQIEDWASDYKIPLGLTSNASVFSSTTMLVFLVTPKVSKVTIWWDGRDNANQTSQAYKNRYFTGDDVITNPDSGILTNGILRLTIQRVSEFGVTAFKVTSNIVGSTVTATARFMRINGKNATYGSGTAYVIHHGIVRDIVQQEAEFSGGIPNSTNLYTHIVLTLPANATYYTYQLRLMFINSQQNRTITDLCPIKLTASIGSPQTENGISSGFPIVQNGTGTFFNSSSVWQHHWSQIISGTKGAGIMFTDYANKMLYAFDTSTSKTGALKVDSTARTIELLPVTMSSRSFTSAKDVIWYGAVVTFDGTTPIYNSSNKSGLWVTVEYPPRITVTTQS
jgi:hypothetical protein